MHSMIFATFRTNCESSAEFIFKPLALGRLLTKSPWHPSTLMSIKLFDLYFNTKCAHDVSSDTRMNSITSRHALLRLSKISLLKSYSCYDGRTLLY